MVERMFWRTFCWVVRGEEVLVLLQAERNVAYRMLRDREQGRRLLL